MNQAILTIRLKHDDKQTSIILYEDAIHDFHNNIRDDRCIIDVAKQWGLLKEDENAKVLLRQNWIDPIEIRKSYLVIMEKLK